jgi:IS30 family transposase
MARSKLSNQQVLEIRRRAREGVTARTMARELLVSAETIRRVVRMETHLMVEVGQDMVEALKG